MLATTLLLGLSLAMDCFAIAITQGLRTSRHRPLIILAILFGLFQGGMLALGHILGLKVGTVRGQYIDWLAALLLFWIGGKMLKEGFFPNHEAEWADLTQVKDYLILAIATSIDAMAAGLSLQKLGLEVIFASLIVGLTSILMGLMGGFFGKQLGSHLGAYSEVLGGLVLLGLGIKVLF